MRRTIGAPRSDLSALPLWVSPQVRVDLTPECLGCLIEIDGPVKLLLVPHLLQPFDRRDERIERRLWDLFRVRHHLVGLGGEPEEPVAPAVDDIHLAEPYLQLTGGDVNGNTNVGVPDPSLVNGEGA